MKYVLVCHKYGVPLDDPCCYPLGFMYVSSALKASGHQVKVLNYNLLDYDLVDEIKDADAVMFTGFEEFRPYIIRDAKICREMGITTILGGALATFDPDSMKPHVDILFSGEFDNGKQYPDYEGFGIWEYHKRHKLRYMGVLTSRGCPYHCTFCAQTCVFSKRELSDVFAEIAIYRSVYGAQTIVFNDNTLNLNKRRWMEICEEMRIPWCAAIRPDKFDDEMARAAKESGCFRLIVGIESFNQEKLDRLKKKTTVAQIMSTLDMCRKYEIDYYGNVLVGFEGETYDDINLELSSIPVGYNVYPCLVQPFIGIKDGRSRAIDADQQEVFDAQFRKLIASQGKYCYPRVQ